MVSRLSLRKRILRCWPLAGLRRTPAHDGSGPSAPLSFERLEERTLLSTLTVNSLADNTIAGDGLVTLREAIAAANSGTATDLNESGEAGLDEIVFQAGLDGMIALTLGDLDIRDDLTITGHGRRSTVIDAQQLSRIFDVSGDGLQVALHGMTLKNGRTTADGDSGGAIRWETSGNSGLTISHSMLSGNSTGGADAEGGALSVKNLSGGITVDVHVLASTLNDNQTDGERAHGGAIALRNASLELTDSVVVRNRAAGDDADGGGIFGDFGQLSIVRSTVNSNAAADDGGAIAMSEVRLETQDSTFANNVAREGSGGAIWGWGGFQGRVFLSNSTVSGNRAVGASAEGGGIYGFNLPITLQSSTVTGNAAEIGGGVAAYADANRALVIKSSIVAGNHASVNPDVTAPIYGGHPNLAVTHSLIGDSAGTGLAEAQSADGAGNLIGSAVGAGVIDPRLGPLENNGGPTWTHALLDNSPAIDAGGSTPPLLGQSFAGDQRGFPYHRISNGAMDMGSFEVQVSDGQPLTLHGTDGDDLFVYDADRRWLQINDVGYLQPEGGPTLQLDGGDGIDRLQVTAATGSGRIVLRPGRALVEHDSAHSGFEFVAGGVEKIVANGSARGYLAVLTDSPGDDRLVVVPGYAVMSSADGPGDWINEVKGITRLHAFASQGNDTAVLTGTGGINDQFQLSPTDSLATNKAFRHEVHNFDVVIARNQGLLSNLAVYGSAGDDTLVVRPGSGRLTGDGFDLQFVGFNESTAFGGEGVDRVTVIGTTGDDRVEIGPDRVYQRAASFGFAGAGFEFATAYGGGGNDSIFLSDGPGDDTFVGFANQGWLAGAGNAYVFRAIDFAGVRITGTTGSNRLLVNDALDYRLIQDGNWQ
ncbi:MAG: hypothetical protein KDA75_03450 [Planctomycetaceae bacterium]|nr:hypothetical protein [Planctomycetaceae bacterium]